MYGHSSCTGFGQERVDSIQTLIASIKRRQLLKPQGQFRLKLGNRQVKVSLLPSELIEFDGEVLALPDERRFEERLAASPGYLGDLL